MGINRLSMDMLLLDIATKPVPTEHVGVTPEIATYWLKNYQYDRQRPLRDFQVDRLVESMRMGSFKLSEVKFVGTPSGKFYLINGQHRLHAILKYNKPVLLQITTIMVDHYNDVAQYYVTEDRGLARTLPDTYTALDLPDRLGVSRSAIPPLSAALLYISANLHGGQAQTIRKKITDQRRIDLLQEWRKEIREVYQYCPRGVKGRLPATFWVNTALAIQLITLRYQNILAREFWTKTLSQEGLIRGMPAYALSHYCQVRPKVTSTMDQEYVARAFALSWNHFFRKSSVFLIQPGRMDFSKPFEILGTPYNGKEWGPDPKWWDAPDKVREYEGEL